ncbi:MAG TPA: dephospho-CoA kinase [Polyangiaceae bacterium]|nr:dephospho-CoA kinase [Polyangiaceae bacterium]
MGFVLFGLTGGLASGKSSVARRFRERGVSVIDADEVAREVVTLGSEGLGEVARHFGARVLAADGSLDRKVLGAIVFADPSARRDLEAITHPRIARATQERADALAKRGDVLACYEAALLIERGIADAFRPLVVVAADEALQIARAMARDGIDEREARARLAAQLPLSDKAAVADYVIRNDGDQAALSREADRVLDAICRSRHVDPARFPAPRATR